MPTIEEQLAEVEAQLAASNDAPEPEVKEEEVTPEEPEVTEPEPEAEPEQEPEQEEEKPIKDAKTAYEERESKRLRRELDEARAREAKLLEAVTRQQPQAEQPKQQVPQRPDAEIDPDGAALYDMQKELREIKLRELQRESIQEVAMHLQNIKEELPDAEAVIDAGAQQTMQALRLLNPSITPMQAQKAVEQSMLQIAMQATVAGKNPAKAIYDHFTSLGIKAPTREAPVVKEANTKPSEADKLKAVMRNKVKSGSPLTGSGSAGKVPLNAEKKMNLTPAEYMRLSPEERASFAN